MFFSELFLLLASCSITYSVYVSKCDLLLLKMLMGSTGLIHLFELA